MKKIFAIVTAVFLFAGVVCSGSRSIAAADANDGYTGIISGKYDSDSFEGDEHMFYYSDDYFRESGTKKNDHLRTMSAALAMTAMQKNPSDTVKNILEATGFEDVKTYGFDSDGMDIIVVSFAHKKIDDNDLISIAVRGDKYTFEWGSNLTIGENGDAKGFSQAASLVKSHYDEYVSEYSLSPKKVWAAGYSRGGAVCDLFGKYLNQNAASIGLAEDDIYIYTFEAPAASADDVSFSNIHNCVDENDAIPYALPSAWGFTNCGVKEIVSTGKKKMTRKVLDYSKLLSAKDVKDALDNSGTAKYGDYAANVIDWLAADKYISRKTYVEKLENHARELTAAFAKRDKDGLDAVEKYFKDEFSGQLRTDENKFKLTCAFLGLYARSEEGLNVAHKNVKQVVLSILDMDAAKKALTQEEIAALKNCIDDVLSVALPIIKDDLTAHDDLKGDRKKYNEVNNAHYKDKTVYNLSKVAKSADEKESWYAGYNDGYDKGNEDSLHKAKYDNTLGQISENAKDKTCYNAGYIYGYFEGYIFPLKFGSLDHPAERICTIAFNAENIAKVHYPKNNIKLIEAQDSYYQTPPEIGGAASKKAEEMSKTGSIFGSGNNNIWIMIVIILVGIIAVETVMIVRNKKKNG